MSNSTFKVSLHSKGDLGTDRDAGGSLATALAIEAKTYPPSYMGGKDKMDTFAFKAKKGERYFVAVVPNEGLEGGCFEVDVSDEL